MESNIFKAGDKIHTYTDAVYEHNQMSLNNLDGIVINSDDKWDIHIKLDKYPKIGNIGFSELELKLN